MLCNHRLHKASAFQLLLRVLCWNSQPSTTWFFTNHCLLCISCNSFNLNRQENAWNTNITCFPFILFPLLHLYTFGCRISFQMKLIRIHCQFWYLCFAVRVFWSRMSSPSIDTSALCYSIADAKMLDYKSSTISGDDTANCQVYAYSVFDNGLHYVSNEVILFLSSLD